MDRAVLHAAKQWDKRREAEIDAQEFPPQYEGGLLFCVGHQALELIAQRGCGVSLSRAIFRNIFAIAYTAEKFLLLCCFVLLSCCDIFPTTFENFRYPQASLEDGKKHQGQPSLIKILTAQETKVMAHYKTEDEITESIISG